jgi:hypothetical protein
MATNSFVSSTVRNELSVENDRKVRRQDRGRLGVFLSDAWCRLDQKIDTDAEQAEEDQ